MSLFLFTAAGLVLLIFGGDFLVRGAVSLSLRLGIPALIVSLTVVAFGTSAPELLIAIKAALAGVPGIALGNVIGSNTANVLLVMGVPAMISVISMAECDTRRSYLQMLAATVAFIVLCFLGPLHIWHGLLLLALLAAMLISAARAAGRSRMAPEDIEEGEADMARWKIAAYILGGLIALPLGAQFLIQGATGLAAALGFSDAVFGLLLVAIGTSLPEFATTVAAAWRRQADVVLGNVIGSNMFNLLAIMGVASLFGPLEVDQTFLRYDLWVMAAASLMLAPFVFYGVTLGRVMGAGFLVAFGVYIATLF